MSFKHIKAIELVFEGEPVGVLAESPQSRNIYAFEYFSSWIKNGFAVNPLHLPLVSGTKAFSGLSRDTWHGLPPAIADSLPDKFGNALIDAEMARMGVSARQITALDRLSYVADRAMGALEFRPARTLEGPEPTMLDIAEIVSAARDAFSGNIFDLNETQHAVRQLLSVGTSAGGARAKAVVNVDPGTQVLTSGQRPQAGRESWLLKFDGIKQEGGLGESGLFGRIEYAYSLMAKDAGIDIAETRLLEEGGRAHFMARRFDRIDTKPGGIPQKIHMQSLCAMDNIDFNLLHTNDYASLFSVIRHLEMGETTATEAFRRMAFNILAMNCDDHSKNFSFIMNEPDKWRLAPAYDLTFAYDPQSLWLKEHLMGVDGKFMDVTEGDLLAFADKYAVQYAKRVLTDIKAALTKWPCYAQRAKLPKEAADKIAKTFTE